MNQSSNLPFKPSRLTGSVPVIKRKSVESHFWNLLDDNKNSLDIAYYYGQGGIGKTWLSKSIQKELYSLIFNEDKKLVTCLLDFSAVNSNALDYLIELRVQLESSFRCANRVKLKEHITPVDSTLYFIVFDNAFQRYMRRSSCQGTEANYISIIKNAFNKRINQYSDFGDFVDNLDKILDSFEVVKDFDAPGVAKFFVEISKKSVNKIKSTNISKKYVNYLIEEGEVERVVEEGDDETLFQILAEALCRDISIFSANNPEYKLVVIFDDYHKRQFNSQCKHQRRSLYTDKWIDEIAFHLEHIPIIFLFFSRKRLDIKNDDRGTIINYFKIPVFTEAEALTLYQSLPDIPLELHKSLTDRSTLPYYVAEQYKLLASAKGEFDAEQIGLPLDAILERTIGKSHLPIIKLLSRVRLFDRCLYGKINELFPNEFAGIPFEQISLRDYVHTLDNVNYYFDDLVIEELNFQPIELKLNQKLHHALTRYYLDATIQEFDSHTNDSFYMNESVYHLSAYIDLFDSYEGINDDFVFESVNKITSWLEEQLSVGQISKVFLSCYNLVHVFESILNNKSHVHVAKYIKDYTSVLYVIAKANSLPRQFSDPNRSKDICDSGIKIVENHKKSLRELDYLCAYSKLIYGAGLSVFTINNSSSSLEIWSDDHGKKKTKTLEQVELCIKELIISIDDNRCMSAIYAHMMLTELFELQSTFELQNNASKSVAKAISATNNIEKTCDLVREINPPNEPELLRSQEIKSADLYLLITKIQGLNTDYAEKAVRIYERYLTPDGQKQAILDSSLASLQWVRAKTYLGDSLPRLENELALTHYRDVADKIKELFFSGKTVPVNLVRWLLKSEYRIYRATKSPTSIDPLRDLLDLSLKGMVNTPITTQKKLVWLLKRFSLMSADWARDLRELAATVLEDPHRHETSLLLKSLYRYCVSCQCLFLNTAPRAKYFMPLLLDEVSQFMEGERDDDLFDYGLLVPQALSMICSSKPYDLYSLDISDVKNLTSVVYNYIDNITTILRLKIHQALINYFLEAFSTGNTILNKNNVVGVLIKLYIHLSSRYASIGDCSNSHLYSERALHTARTFGIRDVTLYRQVCEALNRSSELIGAQGENYGLSPGGNLASSLKESQDEISWDLMKSLEGFESIESEGEQDPSLELLIDGIKECLVLWSRENDTPSQFKAIRNLWSLIATNDKSLPITSSIRRLMRNKYATWTFQLLAGINSPYLKRDKKRRYKPYLRLHPNRKLLSNFENGESDAFFDGLYDIYSCYRPKFSEKELRSGLVGIANPVDETINNENEMKFMRRYKVYIVDTLLSVLTYHEGLSRNKNYFVSTLYGKKDGYSFVTERGPEHCVGLINIAFPGAINEIKNSVFMGASNSWLVLRVDQDYVSQLLTGGGWLVRQLQKALGLRRITLIPDLGRNSVGSLEAIKYFINASWSSLQIVHYDPLNVVLKYPRMSNADSDDVDLRKDRTFISMFKKVFPYTDVSIVYE